MPPYPTILSPPQSKTPCPFMDKKLQTITSNWTSNLRPCNEAIPKTPLNSITLCISRNYLISPKNISMTYLYLFRPDVCLFVLKNIINVGD
jgi:hypothetical protein